MATIFPLSSARLPRSLANKIQDLREDAEARGNLERRVAAYENEKAAATIQKMKSGLTPRQQLVQGIARKEGIADDHLPEEPKKSARKLVLKKESPRAAAGALMDRTGAGKRAAAAAAAEWRWRREVV